FAIRQRPSLSCFLPISSPSCLWTFFQPNTFSAVAITNCELLRVLSADFFAIGAVINFFASNDNPSESIAAAQAVAVDGLKRNILSRLTNDNADVAVTTPPARALMRSKGLETD